MEFARVDLYGVAEDGSLSKLADNCVIRLDPSRAVGSLSSRNGADQAFSPKDSEFCQLGGTNVGLTPCGSATGWILRFPAVSDADRFSDGMRLARKSAQSSIFEMRTDEASASQYFQFYGYLSQQQNMMQDYIRTATYQKAMLANLSDFKDKVVLDVGAGSGILSFFALQSGARKVYAVEASSMAVHCENLVKFNRCEGKIIVVAGKIEEINIPEPVDTIISEPMGYMLLNERMLESFLHGKKFLRPGGKMYPSRGDLHMAPFSDEGLYLEQCSKANFWCQEYFYGVNLSSLRDQALKEYFKQPVVDTFDIRMCLAKTHTYSIDFGEADESTLHRIEIPLNFLLLQTGMIHGLAFWFDVAFIGSNQTVWLSTSPTEPLTHWYQVRCLLQKPLMGKQGHICSGKLLLQANKRQSYDVDVQLTCDGQTSENQLDLKNPYFRYTGQIVPPPPGQNNTSPTENYWNNMAAQNTGEVLNTLNTGVNGNGLMNGTLGPTEYGLLQQQQPPSISANLNLMNLYNFGHQQQQQQQSPVNHGVSGTLAQQTVNAMQQQPQQRF